MSTTSVPVPAQVPPTAPDQDGAEGPGDPRPLSLTARVGVTLLFVVVLGCLATITVLRYTAPYIQADGVLQSIMSVQDVNLFFWGQNRFASVVPFLASPIADPTLNLLACLLLNAGFFYGLLLVLSWMGLRAVAGRRSWTALLVLWLVVSAAVNVLIAPGTIQIIALETQPYSLSWLLALGAFLLWKRSVWWAYAAAVAMVAVAVGLNQSVIVGAAFLAVVEMVRRRQWLRWPALGAVYVLWFGAWAWMSARWGGIAGPIPDSAQDYLSFDSLQVSKRSGEAVGSIVGALAPIRFSVVLVVACLCLLALSPARRSALVPRLALITAFSTGYFVLFAGNSWVAANNFAVRYFFPVLMAIILIVSVPIAAVLLDPPVLRHRGTRPLAIGLALVAVAASLAGPLVPPSRSQVFQSVQATVDYARENRIDYLAGFYWDVWPTLYGTLQDGRESHFATAFKSGGDPEAYEARLDADLATGQAPRALCINESDDVCEQYLGYWTKPGWTWTGETCPAPLESSPPQRSCRVLQYDGQP